MLRRPWRTPEAAKAGDAHLEAPAGIWRNAFIRMPYAREFLTPAGLINDTFETAITWDRFEGFHDKVKAATERAILEADRPEKARSHAASPMSIRRAPRPIFLSTRSAATVLFWSSGRRSRMRPATR